MFSGFNAQRPEYGHKIMTKKFTKNISYICLDLRYSQCAVSLLKCYSVNTCDTATVM